MTTYTREDQARAQDFLNRLADHILTHVVTARPNTHCDLEQFKDLNCCPEHQNLRAVNIAFEREAIDFGLHSPEVPVFSPAWFTEFLSTFELTLPADSPMCELLVEA